MDFSGEEAMKKLRIQALQPCKGIETQEKFALVKLIKRKFYMTSILSMPFSKITPPTLFDMPEQEIITLEYIKGFTAGYTLSNAEPDLAKKLQSATSEKSEYLQAFKAGAKQAQKEKLQAEQKTIFERNKKKSKTK